MPGAGDPSTDPMCDQQTDVETLIDASDRLERVLERQLSTIDGIDEKAANVGRLIGILLGLVFGVLSLASNADHGSLPRPDVPVLVAFFIGMTGLLAAMGAAIVTYLSSKFRSGLHYNVGYYLGEPDAVITHHAHLRRVLGTYADIIEQNKRVVETNSNRFRRTLWSLLMGVLFLSVAGGLYVGQVEGWYAWSVFLVTIGLASLSTWYILTGKYLTLDGVG